MPVTTKSVSEDVTAYVGPHYDNSVAVATDDDTHDIENASMKLDRSADWVVKAVWGGRKHTVGSCAAPISSRSYVPR